MSNKDIYEDIARVLRGAKDKAYQAVNFAMVEAYWQVGRMIVEEEQRGNEQKMIRELAVVYETERIMNFVLRGPGKEERESKWNNSQI